MSGPAPKATRRRANIPVRGDWQPVTGLGWQHGPPPSPPAGLLKASRDAWTAWMAAWFASHWTPDDLPGLRTVIRLYDEVERGRFTRVGELRQYMDGYGITPKGQQDRRWSPPKPEDKPAAPGGQPDGLYDHLRAV
jgi:hypothetical protein